MPSLLQRRRILASSSSWTPMFFSPSDWWDFSKVGGAHNDPISTCESQMRSNAMTAAGTARPLLQTGASGLGGRSVALFDGVDDVMTCSLSPHTTACSFFLVVKNAAAILSNYFLSGSVSGIGVSAYEPGGQDNVYARGVANGFTGLSSTSWRMIDVQYTPGTCRVYKAGALAATHSYTSTSATGGAYMGKGDSFTYWLNGCVATVLCFDRQLSDAEASLVRAWLNTYYGGGLL